MKLTVSYTWALFFIWALGLTLLVWKSVAFCDGHLVYTIDDPYIHLSVAENILNGGYGVNAGEYSAPSSSIIYPFILVATEWAGLGVIGPLVVNILAMGFAVLLLGKILAVYVLPFVLNHSRDVINYILGLGLGVGAFLTMNAWGLVMTGMEHSIHIFLCLSLIYGFLKLIDGELSSMVFLIPTIAFLPLIRFEGFALAILAIFLLYYLGFKRHACWIMLIIAGMMAGWVSYMHNYDLPILPSSVQLKSALARNVGNGSISVAINAVAQNVVASLSEHRGRFLWVSLITLLFFTYKAAKQTKNYFGLSVIILLSGFAHIISGKFGWFARYEVYVSISVWVVILIMSREILQKFYVKAGLILVMLIGSKPNLHVSLISPAASRNIYEQQYQMHRFCTDFWKRPVAVNDLGLVSYQNNSYVLDLWGLGSEEVRILKVNGVYTASKINELVHKKGVNLIIIYDAWFKERVPKEWIKVCSLQTSEVSSGSGSVEFYVTPEANIVEIRNLLLDFEMGLPAGAKLTHF